MTTQHSPGTARPAVPGRHRKADTMSSTGSAELTARKAEIAALIGLPVPAVTDGLIARIADDDLFLHHLQTCKDDPGMLAILLRGVPADAPRHSGFDLVRGAGVALARWSASGFRKVDDELYESRLATCRGCEHLTTPRGNTLLYRITATSRAEPSTCGLCGCDVRRKARLATEHCPDDRWPAVRDDQSDR